MYIYGFPIHTHGLQGLFFLSIWEADKELLGDMLSRIVGFLRAVS